MYNTTDIYPSQLATFKERTLEYALEIERHCGIKPSSFKRNDAVALAMGYKGHSDLTVSAKQNALGDKKLPFIILDTSRVANQFISALPNLDPKLIENACHQVNLIEKSRMQIIKDSKQLFACFRDDITLAPDYVEAERWGLLALQFLDALEIVLNFKYVGLNKQIDAKAISDHMPLVEICILARADMPKEIKQPLLSCLGDWINDYEIDQISRMDKSNVFDNRFNEKFDFSGYITMQYIPTVHRLIYPSQDNQKKLVTV